MQSRSDTGQTVIPLWMVEAALQALPPLTLTGSWCCPLVRSARVLCNLPFQEGKKKFKSGFPESHIFEMPDYKSKGVLEHITFVSFINLDFRLFLESEFLVFCGAWQKIRLLIAKLGWQRNRPGVGRWGGGGRGESRFTRASATPFSALKSLWCHPFISWLYTKPRLW